MKYSHNIKELSLLPVDMMGLIFYEASPRYAGNMAAGEISAAGGRLHKVGVFVDATEAEIISRRGEYDLRSVQLHGNESPEFCRKVRGRGVEVIKAFRIETAADFAACGHYADVCDCFLFDTKTDKYGGSGKKFDWGTLAAYAGPTPFLLSGGIGGDDAEALAGIRHPHMMGVDLNSRFEIRPGEKDIALLRAFCRRFLENVVKGSQIFP
jgi:phosphoribosylanthranilate isomerase